MMWVGCSSLTNFELRPTPKVPFRKDLRGSFVIAGISRPIAGLFRSLRVFLNARLILSVATIGTSGSHDVSTMQLRPCERQMVRVSSLEQQKRTGWQGAHDVDSNHKSKNISGVLQQVLLRHRAHVVLYHLCHLQLETRL